MPGFCGIKPAAKARQPGRISSVLCSFLSIIVYLVLGIMIWVKAKWPWLVIGSMIIFVLTGIQGDSAVIASGIGEIIFFTIVVWTFYRLTEEEQETQAKEVETTKESIF